jgi:hypothetical protein
MFFPLVHALPDFLFFHLEGWINLFSLPGSTHFEIIIPQLCVSQYCVIYDLEGSCNADKFKHLPPKLLVRGNSCAFQRIYFMFSQ